MNKLEQIEQIKQMVEEERNRAWYTYAELEAFIYDQARGLEMTIAEANRLSEHLAGEVY